MLTPAMSQYYDIKKEYDDSIIFFRMGDFYEMFGEDAEIAHKVLGINITSRNKNALNPEKLAGIPYHAKDKYLPILVNAGYKVAIVEQVSDPKLKGIVKREVQRVVTPATLNLEGDNFDNFDNNTVISITYLEKTKKYGFSILDLLSNKWQIAEFDNFSSLEKELFKLNPKEVILDKKLFGFDDLKQTLQKKYSLNIYYFENSGDSEVLLKNHFGVKSLAGFGIDKLNLGIEAGALLLNYLTLNQKNSLSILKSIGVYNDLNYLKLDNQTIKNLDLVYNFLTGSEVIGTLFGVLNNTKTSMGKRLLKSSILNPLYDIKEIQKRQDFVEIFFKDKILLSKVREKLSYVSDVEIILNRLSLDRASPRDLLNLKQSLISILEVIDLIKNYDNIKLKEILK
ncbi:hypothetical protein H3C61_03915 [Candidatus Gracilibacteria bacterium]|nr:hypothetical protein [Candidatus Gracilibacteria bacterium]